MATMSYTASAQFSVDQAGIEKKLAKADADVQNAKKAEKAATWLSRGDSYYDAVTEPTSGLYVGMAVNATKLVYGTSVVGEIVEFEGAEFEKYSFGYFDAYFSGGALVFWESTVAIGGEDAIDTAIESYVTALEKDPRSASRVQERLTAISDYYKTLAGNYFQGKNITAAAESFENSYYVCALPAMGVVDTLSIYNAGYLYTAANEFQKGIDALEEAEKHGYDGDGESQFFRGICYLGLEDFDGAKNILIAGLQKYPSNSRIVEGLMSLYATTGENPDEIIPYVQSAIDADPTNYVYYDGLGRIYDKLGDTDNCLAAFMKAAELAPEEFTTQFNLGMLYIRKANSIYDEIREIPNASQEDYDAGLARQAEYFRSSISPLEKSVVLNPESYDAVQALKNVTFRLRAEDGMQALYDKYTAMLDGMSE